MKKFKRAIADPIASNPTDDQVVFYTLCLDVFDFNGQFLGTRIYNLPVPH